MRWPSEQGVPEAQFQYALLLLDGGFVKKDVNGAYALLEAAAEAGNVLAQFNFAQLVVDREPGEAGMAKAVSYYERAARGRPCRRAICDVADIGQRRRRQEARRGRGAPLADDGCAPGISTPPQLDLGTWMIEGRGGPRDRKGGFDWLKRAADGGNVAAQNRVAKLYVQGHRHRSGPGHAALPGTSWRAAPGSATRKWTIS